MVTKIDKQILKESMAKLQEQDKLILCQYFSGVKQNLIAKNFNISPSAINQRLEKIIYNYRTILCNDEIFTQSSFYDKFQSEPEYLFNAYLREVRQKRMLSIDLNEVKNLIKEIRKAITKLDNYNEEDIEKIKTLKNQKRIVLGVLRLIDKTHQDFEFNSIILYEFIRKIGLNIEKNTISARLSEFKSFYDQTENKMFKLSNYGRHQIEIVLSNKNQV